MSTFVVGRRIEFGYKKQELGRHPLVLEIPIPKAVVAFVPAPCGVSCVTSECKVHNVLAPPSS